MLLPYQNPCGWKARPRPPTLEEKYWDLASVPGYDPSFLVGWRLSHVWTQRERQGHVTDGVHSFHKDP